MASQKDPFASLQGRRFTLCESAQEVFKARPPGELDAGVRKKHLDVDEQKRNSRRIDEDGRIWLEQNDDE
jgi:hypothetical protein